MAETITVQNIEGDCFEVAIRQHRLRVDQPVADGGSDSAPTPTELFVSSLAACVAFYARRFLVRHNLPVEGLSIEMEYALAAHPTRVGEITIKIRVPESVPEDRRAGLLSVASHCTVHNSLQHLPVVHIEMSREKMSSGQGVTGQS